MTMIKDTIEQNLIALLQKAAPLGMTVNLMRHLYSKNTFSSFSKCRV